MGSNDPTLRIEIDVSDFDGDRPTSPAPFDVDAFARASQEEKTGRLRALSAHDILAGADVSPSAPLDAVPVLAVARADLAWYELSADATGLLLRVDGASTLMQLLVDYPIAPADGARLVGELVREGVVRLR